MSLTPLIPSMDDMKRMALASNQGAPSLASLRAPQGPMPSLGSLPSLPQQPAPQMPTLRPLVTSPRQQQEQSLQGKISAYENPSAPKPGFWHSLGRVAAKVGNIAGDIVAPGTMSLIPGTDLYKQGEHARNVVELESLQKQDQTEQANFADNTLRQAQATKISAETPTEEDRQAGLEHTQAETEALGRPDLAHAYATAVTSAMKRGDDPSADPVVQHLADAITSIQKQPTPKEDQTKTTDLLGSDGKQHIMGWNPQSKKYDIDMGIKGEKPAAAPGVTVMVPNAQGGYSVQRAGVGQEVAPGAVTPAGMSSLNVPTSSTRTMVETAPRVIELADRAEQLIDPQIQTLGPAASRWAEFMAGKVGAPNPEFTKLRTNIGLLSTALMRMHVGARGGEQIMQHFADLIDSSKQSPENLKAALEEIKQYANQVKTEVPGGRNQEPSTKQPTRPANVPEGYVLKDGPKGKGWYKPDAR